MGFFELLLWWLSIGMGLGLMYIFLYHCGPESWIEYQVYLEKHHEDDEDTTETKFADIQRMGGEHLAAFSLIIMSSIFPFVPLLMLLHDVINYPSDS